MDEALQSLASLDLDEDHLKQEWRHQVSTQTRPLVRATKALGKREVQAILDLMDWSKTLRKDIRSLDHRISK